mgnify:CR=1 FL=1
MFLFSACEWYLKNENANDSKLVAVFENADNGKKFEFDDDSTFFMYAYTEELGSRHFLDGVYKFPVIMITRKYNDNKEVTWTGSDTESITIKDGALVYEGITYTRTR